MAMISRGAANLKRAKNETGGRTLASFSFSLFFLSSSSFFFRDLRKSNLLFLYGCDFEKALEIGFSNGELRRVSEEAAIEERLIFPSAADETRPTLIGTVGAPTLGAVAVG